MRLTKKTKLTAIIALQAIFIISLAVSYNAFSNAHINNIGPTGAVNHAPPYPALNATAATAEALIKDPATIVPTQATVPGAERVVSTSDGNVYLFFTTVPAALASSPNQEVHEIGGVPTTVIRISQADLARLTAVEGEKAFPYSADQDRVTKIVEAKRQGLSYEVGIINAALFGLTAPREARVQLLSEARYLVPNSLIQLKDIDGKQVYIAVVKIQDEYFPLLIGLNPSEIKPEYGIAFVPIASAARGVIATSLSPEAENIITNLPANSPEAIAWQPIISLPQFGAAIKTTESVKSVPVAPTVSLERLDFIPRTDERITAFLLDRLERSESFYNRLVQAGEEVNIALQEIVMPYSVVEARTADNRIIYFALLNVEHTPWPLVISKEPEQILSFLTANPRGIALLNRLPENFVEILAAAPAEVQFQWTRAPALHRLLGVDETVSEEKGILDFTARELLKARLDQLQTPESVKAFPAIERVSLSDSTASLSVYKWINLFYSQQGGIESEASLKIQEVSKILARVEKASLYDTKMQDALANPEIGSEIKQLLITPIIEKGLAKEINAEEAKASLDYVSSITIFLADTQYAQQGSALYSIAEALARAKNNIPREQAVSSELTATEIEILRDHLLLLLSRGNVKLVRFEIALEDTEALQYRTLTPTESKAPIMRPFTAVLRGDGVINVMSIPQTEFAVIREQAATELISGTLRSMLEHYSAFESLQLPAEEVDKLLKPVTEQVLNIDVAKSTTSFQSITEAYPFEDNPIPLKPELATSATIAGVKAFPQEAALGISSLIQTASAGLPVAIKQHADNANLNLQAFDTALEEAAFTAAPEASPAKLQESLVALGNAKQNLTDLGQNMPQAIKTNALPAVAATHDLAEQTIAFGRTLLERANAVKTTEAIEVIANIKTPVTVAYGPGLFEDQVVSMNFGTHKKTCNFNAVTQDDFNNDGVALVYYKGDIKDVLANQAIAQNQAKIVFVKIDDQAAQQFSNAGMVCPIPHMNIAGIYTALYVKAGYRNPVVKSMIDSTLSLIMGMPVDIDTLLSNPEAAAAFIIKTIEPLYRNYTGDVGELQRRLYLALIAA